MADEFKDENLDEEDTQKGKFMTFKVGKEYFGISIDYVNEIVVMQPITKLPQIADYIRGLINLRGKIIPVIDVRARFKMGATEDTDRTCIIVINVKSTVIGLVVEQIATVDTIPDANIVPPPTLSRKEEEHNKYVYGLARIEGTVKLLLDPEKLINDEELNALEAAGGEEE